MLRLKLTHVSETDPRKQPFKLHVMTWELIWNNNKTMETRQKGDKKWKKQNKIVDII